MRTPVDYKVTGLLNFLLPLDGDGLNRLTRSGSLGRGILFLAGCCDERLPPRFAAHRTPPVSRKAKAASAYRRSLNADGLGKPVSAEWEQHVIECF